MGSLLYGDVSVMKKRDHRRNMNLFSDTNFSTKLKILRVLRFSRNACKTKARCQCEIHVKHSSG